MKIFFSHSFKAQLKKLKKKYPHIKNDLLEKLKTLHLKNEIHIGNSIYKVRIKSSDQNKGKSGGFRSYIYLYRKNNLLVPLSIYHKNQRENMSDNEIQYLLEKITEEILSQLSGDK